jgi:GNAT superfamily N-acetyltransferase
VESAYRGDSAKHGWTHEADLLGGQRTDPALLRDVLSAQNETVLLALVGDDLIGCVQISMHGDKKASLGMLSVNPARQTAGVGKHLIAAAQAHAKASGATRMEMRVIAQRKELIAFYLRRGYADTGATARFPYGDERFGLPLRDDLTFVILAKDL